MRFHPVNLLGEHRMFRVRIDVEAISPELALRLASGSWPIFAALLCV
jgi:hypothetical protein